MGAATDVELLARAVRNPGRLCMGPSSNAGSFPFGGLALGFTRGMGIRFGVKYRRRKDGSSGATNEVGRGVEDLALGCVLEGVPWDEDMVKSIFTKTATSGFAPAETQIVGASIPRVVPALPPLLFNGFGKGLSVYIRRPVLLLNIGQAIAMAHKHLSGLPIIFIAEPVLNLDPWYVSQLEAMTVP